MLLVSSVELQQSLRGCLTPLMCCHTCVRERGCEREGRREVRSDFFLSFLCCCGVWCSFFVVCFFLVRGVLECGRCVRGKGMCEGRHCMNYSSCFQDWISSQPGFTINHHLFFLSDLHLDCITAVNMDFIGCCSSAA